MIRLEDVCFLEAINFTDDHNIKSLFDINSVYNLNDVLYLIKKYPSYDWSSVKRRLKKVFSCVDNANLKFKEPILYDTKPYLDKSLSYNDKLNYGNVLLLPNPSTNLQIKYRELYRYNIDSICSYLKLCDRNGYNYIVKRMRNIGEDSIKSIINAISMYREQVYRQSLITKDRDINLFTMDLETKKEIVNDKYSDIINYLVYNFDFTIWGELTDAQKKLYLSSVINNKMLDRTIKDRMINCISNYTTLPELDNVVNNDMKVLKRFVK